MYTRFPSPGGDYGLSDFWRSGQWSHRQCQVSVPWRGLRSFGRSCPRRGGRQPYGVSVPWRGLRSFGPLQSEARLKQHALVSVPWRGLRSFGRLVSRCAKVSHFRVSVPWRGLRSFGLLCSMTVKGWKMWVSVPWRGLRSFGPTKPQAKSLTYSKFPSPGGDYGLSDQWRWFQRAKALIRFPSPGGDYGLSDEHHQRPSRMACAGFRPLAGITVFRTRDDRHARNLGWCVSVPWRGLRSFGQPAAASGPPPNSVFPSPGGDYGLSDSNTGEADLTWSLGFRPLAGITVFRTWDSRCARLARRKVSVPWRGLRSFGLMELYKERLAVMWVSVPWRGLRSFGPDQVHKRAELFYAFPSPGGDYGLSDRNGRSPCGPCFLGFRPLAGITVFRTELTLPTAAPAWAGFRPLAGITVFRTHREIFQHYHGLWVSVPWRGLRSFGQVR